MAYEHDSRLTPIRSRIFELQRKCDDLEWEGLAPEKLSDTLRELQQLQDADARGEVFSPNF